MCVITVLDPLLLDEFKLSGDICVERHEDDSTFFLIGDWFAFRCEASVGKPAPGDATTVDQLAIEAECISRMDAPDVSANGTASAPLIATEGEVGAAVGVLCN